MNLSELRLIFILVIMFTSALIFSQSYEYLPFTTDLYNNFNGVIRSDSIVIVDAKYSSVDIYDEKYIKAVKSYYGKSDSIFIFDLKGNQLLAVSHDRINIQNNFFLGINRNTRNGRGNINFLYNHKGELILSPLICQSFSTIESSNFFIVVDKGDKKKIQIMKYQRNGSLDLINEFSYSLNGYTFIYKRLHDLYDNNNLNADHIKKIEITDDPVLSVSNEESIENQEMTDESSENLNRPARINPLSIDSLIIIDKGRHYSSQLDIYQGELCLLMNYIYNGKSTFLRKKIDVNNAIDFKLYDGGFYDLNRSIAMKNFAFIRNSYGETLVLFPNGIEIDVEFDSIGQKYPVRSLDGILYKVYNGKREGVFCSNGNIIIDPIYYEVSDEITIMSLSSTTDLDDYAYLIKEEVNGKVGVILGDSIVMKCQFDSVRLVNNGIIAENSEVISVYKNGMTYEIENDGIILPYGIKKWGNHFILKIRSSATPFASSGFIHPNGWKYVYRSNE